MSMRDWSGGRDRKVWVIVCLCLPPPQITIQDPVSWGHTMVYWPQAHNAPCKEYWVGETRTLQTWNVAQMDTARKKINFLTLPGACRSNLNARTEFWDVRKKMKNVDRWGTLEATKRVSQETLCPFHAPPPLPLPYIIIKQFMPGTTFFVDAKLQRECQS